MNVQDCISPPVTGDRLEMIFARQKELFEKYHPIEKANGIGHGALVGPFDIDDQRCQYLCKDFAWRVTEEMAESTEARDHKIHAKEEAVDALHFLVELYLINGLSAKQIFDLARVGWLPDEKNDLLARSFQVVITCPDAIVTAYGVVETLGRAMNCLKNKPWKQTQVLTDVERFQGLLGEAWIKWVGYAKALRMTPEITYDLYFRKSNVNAFRIGSDY